jgi:hypothetical protein
VSVLLTLRFCLGVWRGGEGFGKKKEQVEEIEDIERNRRY